MRNLSGEVVNVLNWDILESEFELNSHYYVHFWKMILKKAWTPLLFGCGLYDCSFTKMAFAVEYIDSISAEG